MPPHEIGASEAPTQLGTFPSLFCDRLSLACLCGTAPILHKTGKFVRDPEASAKAIESSSEACWQCGIPGIGWRTRHNRVSFRRRRFLFQKRTVRSLLVFLNFQSADFFGKGS
jgi:hypothetical protein